MRESDEERRGKEKRLGGSSKNRPTLFTAFNLLFAFMKELVLVVQAGEWTLFLSTPK